MDISLNEFEQLIDENILKRGFSYFNKGAIIDFSEVSNNQYEAIVLGTDEYYIKLKIEDNIVKEHNCNCPFDMGPVCKHIVAVFFYLQQEYLELDKLKIKKTNPKNTMSKTKKDKSINQQIKELLKNISHEQLIEFVVENCKEDKKICNAFLASFGHLNQNVSKAFYQNQIQMIFQTASGRDGWISWAEMKYVVKSIQPFLDNAEQYLQKSNFETVFFISTALLEEMTKAIQFTDDSNGDLSYFIDSSLDLLTNLSEVEISNSLRKDIFEYCISSFKQDIFEGWDWHLDILYIAVSFVENESEADLILSFLETIKEEYYKERVQMYKLNLLNKFKGQEQVDNFIDKSISNPNIRKSEIEKAFKQKNYLKLKAIANDGLICDEKSKPGLALVWYDWLLKVAIAENDNQNIIKYARFRLINNFGADLDYYQILKKTIEPEKWKSFLEQIIVEVTPKSNWTYNELIRSIYIKEEWWERLFLMLKQNSSLENIKENEPYLAKQYSAELIELYSINITKYVEKYVSRNHYQYACRFLRRMNKLGGNEQVNILIEQFRKLYPLRKALLDELSKI